MKHDLTQTQLRGLILTHLGWGGDHACYSKLHKARPDLINRQYEGEQLRWKLTAAGSKLAADLLTEDPTLGFFMVRYHKRITTK